MKNIDIIIATAIENEVYTEEQVEEMLTEYGDLPLHTFAEWKRMGMMVQKGQKAIMSALIWQMKKPTKKEIAEAEEQGKEKPKTKFIKVKACFFTEQQVAPIEKK